MSGQGGQGNQSTKGRDNLKEAYRSITQDHFPDTLEICFSNSGERQCLRFQRVTWRIDGQDMGLRYGENPDQEAALYKLVSGNLVLGEVESIHPERYLASDVELLQSGKHPGKINITDVDSALNILRYFQESPCTVIVKHNNPCGVALGGSLCESYQKAYMADRIAAFGGAVVVNRALDRETAELIAEQYCEVVAAPAFAEGVLDILGQRKNLRVMRIGNIRRLQEFVGTRTVDLKTLIDGGIIAQWSYAPRTLTVQDFLPAEATYQGREYRVVRKPTDPEARDLLFGWLVESGITSNSVIYVKDGVTVGIGTGEQDRVGVAEIARDKAYRKLADRICWLRYGKPYNLLAEGPEKRTVDDEVREQRGGLSGACMVSDAFFPFRDGVDVGIREGITAIIQPGGSDRDFEVIEACNEANVAMVFTGQRSFRH
ncbi:MAG: IMP cyclohydrolase [Spirochaetaceae bacterium]|nr:MAG: IMP cyclohydrolase [Spirochaetaceae bacterium]